MINCGELFSIYKSIVKSKIVMLLVQTCFMKLTMVMFLSKLLFSKSCLQFDALRVVIHENIIRSFLPSVTLSKLALFKS